MKTTCRKTRTYSLVTIAVLLLAGPSVASDFPEDALDFGQDTPGIANLRSTVPPEALVKDRQVNWWIAGGDRMRKAGGFHVIVDGEVSDGRWSPGVDNLSSKQLQNIVESELRRKGIAILGDDQEQGSWLVLDVCTSQVYPSWRYVFNLNLTVYQKGALASLLSAPPAVSILQYYSFGVAGKNTLAKTVERGVVEMMGGVLYYYGKPE